MPYVGCHLSASAGNLAMVETAVSIGANTFAFFTRNPRGSRARKEDPIDSAKAVEALKANNFGKLVAHGAYTMNLCNADPDARAFAADVLCDDLRRMAALPGNYYNFHPGSHVGQGTEKGIELIAQLLNDILKPDMQTTVLLETMAGKGSEVGRSFEELRAIINEVELQEHIGVCLDSCHVWDGGYDIAGNLDAVLEEFDRIIGINRLKAIHLNDSMNPLGAHKDRHAKIGEGHIGTSALSAMTNHALLRELPFCLETPNDLNGYAAEIALLRSLYRE